MSPPARNMSGGFPFCISFEYWVQNMRGTRPIAARSLMVVRWKHSGEAIFHFHFSIVRSSHMTLRWKILAGYMSSYRWPAVVNTVSGQLGFPVGGYCPFLLKFLFKFIHREPWCFVDCIMHVFIIVFIWLLHVIYSWSFLWSPIGRVPILLTQICFIWQN